MVLPRSAAARGAGGFPRPVTVGGAFFTYYYVKFGRMIDQRFKGPVFGNSARIYAVARPVQVGEKIEAKEIALQLRRAGYDQNGKSPMGSYRLFEGGIEIKPGSDSYHSPESAIIRVRERQGGKHHQQIRRSGGLRTRTADDHFPVRCRAPVQAAAGHLR